MTRSTKKIVYGIVWWVLLALFLFIIYLIAVKPAPSCSDNRKNQNETGVDCGGGCVPCEARNLQPVRVIREPEVFTTKSGKVTLLAAVLNPNTGYVAASFPYQFTLFDVDGKTLETVPGEDTLFVSETRYLLAQDVATPAGKIDRVELSIGNPQWKPRGEIIRPDLAVQGGATTTIEGGAVFVRGMVRNQSTVTAGSVRVAALLYDRTGNELFVGQGTVTGLAGMSELPFSVQFPADSGVLLRIDPAATRLYVTSR